MIDPDEARWFGLGVFSGAGQLLALYGMPTMKSLDLIVASLFLLGPGAQAQESMPTLDLTQPVSCEDEKLTTISGIVVGTGGGLIHGPPPPLLPLDLRLVDIEPRPLREGGKVTYEVELENVGAAPFLIPWGTECDLLRGRGPHRRVRNDPNKVSAGVSLILDEYPERSPFAYGRGAYGMMDTPRITRSLAPGEKVRIRLSGIIDFSRDDPPDPVRALDYQTKTVIDVRASIYLHGRPYRKYISGKRKSSNVVAVEVTR